MQFDILTLFPDLVHSYASESILGKAQQKNLIKIIAHNFRDQTLDRQRHVDDSPYGGGPGMVLQVEPIYRCLESLGLVKDGKKISPSAREGARGSGRTKILIMDPAGKKFDQRMAEKFAKLDRLVFISGRYEGFDERIYKFVDEKISVGDYVLAGGELPALTIVEAVSRLIPGVLGNAESLNEETHGKFQIPMSKSQINPKSKNQKSKKLVIGHWDLGLFKEYPQYTRPEDFMGLKVPKVLLSGNHELIKKWRKLKSK